MGFNSRPRVRGDYNASPVSHYFGGFQFTPPRKGRPPNTSRTGSAHAFQFTPPRKGRQLERQLQEAMKKVSIHAPA